MSRVALATSTWALPGRDESIVAHLDTDLPLIVDALGDRGVEAHARIWDDPTVQWESYDLVVVRSTWGYHLTPAAFLEWARARPRIVNPYDVLVYSSDKHYLADLASRGVPVVPSTFCEVGETPQFPDGEIVVKPAVGAGSLDADRFGPEDLEGAVAHVAALHARGRCAVIQPYVDDIDEAGETALIFLGGSFSHAITKRAHLRVPPSQRDGDFRARQIAPNPSPDPRAIALGESALRGPFDTLTYARVDVVPVEGRWCVMELELVEPALFLGEDPNALERFTDVVVGCLEET